MPYYYDYIIGGIPTLSIGLGGILLISGIPLTIAISLGALPAIGLIVHALFVRPPLHQNVEGKSNQLPHTTADHTAATRGELPSSNQN